MKCFDRERVVGVIPDSRFGIKMGLLWLFELQKTFTEAIIKAKPKLHHT
jgi:hypothetical protein